MKKVLAFFAALVMLVSLCGCGNEPENIRGEITGKFSSGAESGVLSDEDDAEFSLGKSENNSYRNDFLGLSCTLPDDWVFYNDEQILQLNNMVGDVMDEEAAEQLKNADIIYDMYASNEADGSSINVNLEKINPLQAMTVDIKQSLESQIDMIQSTYQNMGYTDIDVTYQKTTVDGKEFDSLNITAKIQGIDFYARAFTFKKGSYFANVTVCSIGTDKTQTILGYFTVK